MRFENIEMGKTKSGERWFFWAQGTEGDATYEEFKTCKEAVTYMRAVTVTCDQCYNEFVGAPEDTMDIASLCENHYFAWCQAVVI